MNPYKDFDNYLKEFPSKDGYFGEYGGAFLPDEAYLRRFKELGGEIVTVGSDAHSFDRVGQYCKEACELVNQIFGHICTFEDRKPIFHKL